MAARACAPAARIAVQRVGEAGAHKHTRAGYVYAPLPRPGATCARTPRWLISSQISLLDCGAARWSMPARPSPFFRPSLPSRRFQLSLAPIHRLLLVPLISIHSFSVSVRPPRVSTERCGRAAAAAATARPTSLVVIHGEPGTLLLHSCPLSAA